MKWKPNKRYLGYFVEAINQYYESIKSPDFSRALQKKRINKKTKPIKKENKKIKNPCSAPVQY